MGEWLPEPLPTNGDLGFGDHAAHADAAESLSGRCAASGRSEPLQSPRAPTNRAVATALDAINIRNRRIGLTSPLRIPEPAHRRR